MHIVRRVDEQHAPLPVRVGVDKHAGNGRVGHAVEV